MAESVVRACYARATSLKMSSKNLKEVPPTISMLPQLSVLLLNNNHICTLPVELLLLPHLTELNLGNNTFKEIPAVVSHLERLKKLYLYSNQISTVSSEVMGSLKDLCVLNLNHNHIQRLPSEIKSLTKLHCLSLAHNKLEDIPAELGHLIELTEVNFTHNCLSGLPQEIYHCKQLTKIHLARNQLNSLPEGIRALTKLQVLDVAGNMLSMFPAEFHNLRLKELYCEGNKFVQCKLNPSVLGQEMLSLKELVARFVLREDRNKSSLVHKTLPYYPNLITLLAKGSYCALCLEPILTKWLECVHFVNLRKVMKINKSQTVPVRAHLCSYKCFNAGGHAYYGTVALPAPPPAPHLLRHLSSLPQPREGKERELHFDQINFPSMPLELVEICCGCGCCARLLSRNLMHNASALIANPETNDFGLVNSRGAIHLQQTE